MRDTAQIISQQLVQQINYKQDWKTIEQKNIFRQRNYISQHFTIMVFKVLRQIVVIKQMSVNINWNSFAKKKDIFLSVKNQEITGDSK